MNIAYGKSNFEEIRDLNALYADRTHYIPVLEDPVKGRSLLVFLRPRRFGKSTLLHMLRCYYDLLMKDRFEELFGSLAIGKNPTPEHNRYLILHLDFSLMHIIDATDGVGRRFNAMIYGDLIAFLRRYIPVVPALQTVMELAQSTDHASLILYNLSRTLYETPYRMYLLIDEYDSFTNLLVGKRKTQLYREITSDYGFFKGFFKTVKASTNWALKRLFITGVSPYTLDDLASGANNFANITQHPDFEALLGFTEEEVMRFSAQHLKDIGSTLSLDQVAHDLRQWYNGYCFVADSSQRLYNPDMVLHFFYNLTPTAYPHTLVDHNARIDYTRLRGLIVDMEGNPRPNTLPVLRQVLEQGYASGTVYESFPLDEALDGTHFLSVLVYLGLLTQRRAGGRGLEVPNLVTKVLYWEIFAKLLLDLHHVPQESARLRQHLVEMAARDNLEPFFQYLAESVLRYVSNRDLIHINETSVKLLPLAFISLEQLFLPYSEMELNGGYSDLVLMLNPQYKSEGQYGFVLEFKYLKVGEARANRPGRKKVEDPYGILQDDVSELAPELDELDELPEDPRDKTVALRRRKASIDELMNTADIQLRRYLADPRLDAVKAAGGWKAYSVVFVGSREIHWRALDGRHRYLLVPKLASN